MCHTNFVTKTNDPFKRGVEKINFKHQPELWSILSAIETKTILLKDFNVFLNFDSGRFVTNSDKRSKKRT